MEDIKQENSSDEEINECLPLFEDIVIDFEKTHAFVQKKGRYIMETMDDTISFNYEQLKNQYPHIICFKKGSKKKNFIANWARDYPKIRKFVDMDIFPPPLICPDNIYNLWKPFFGATLKGKYTKDKEALLRFRKHLAILCNKDSNVFEYVEK